MLSSSLVKPFFNLNRMNCWSWEWRSSGATPSLSWHQQKPIGSMKRRGLEQGRGARMQWGRWHLHRCFCSCTTPTPSSWSPRTCRFMCPATRYGVLVCKEACIILCVCANMHALTCVCKDACIILCVQRGVLCPMCVKGHAFFYVCRDFNSHALYCMRKEAWFVPYL